MLKTHHFFVFFPVSKHWYYSKYYRQENSPETKIMKGKINLQHKKQKLRI